MAASHRRWWWLLAALALEALAARLPGRRLRRRGDDLYYYLPSTREFVYRNRKDNLGSTAARTDLFGRQRRGVDELNPHILEFHHIRRREPGCVGIVSYFRLRARERGDELGFS